jgi:hypothetical protein
MVRPSVTERCHGRSPTAIPHGLQNQRKSIILVVFSYLSVFDLHFSAGVPKQRLSDFVFSAGSPCPKGLFAAFQPVPIDSLALATLQVMHDGLAGGRGLPGASAKWQCWGCAG